jgi:hypothetical protein
MLTINKIYIKLALVSMLQFFLFGNLVCNAVNEQPANGGNGRISVFLDAPWWLDTDFVREQISIVNYVRDKELADVHIMMTRHGAGSAGRNYSISFIGRSSFKDMDQELSYWAPSTNSSDDTRRGYTNMLKIGLVRYIATTRLVSRIIVNYDYDKEAIIFANALEPEIDPWNSWVFELYGGGNFRKEELQSNVSSRFGFFADRITEDWKIRMRPYFNLSRRTYISGEDTIISKSHRHGHSLYAVKSINDHWSVGLFNSSESSTYLNTHFAISLTPAVEYSYFPYNEATRRSITLAYRMGYAYRNYYETTIFAKDSEYLMSQSVEATARYQQPWGNFRAGISGSHYFHDFSINRVNVFANVNVRIFQGLALNLNTSLNLINDLIALSAGDMSIEEILLEQSQQATSYNISGSIGISYTFGSDFSAAYNPRL